MYMIFNACKNFRKKSLGIRQHKNDDCLNGIVHRVLVSSNRLIFKFCIINVNNRKHTSSKQNYDVVNHGKSCISTIAQSIRLNVDIVTGASQTIQVYYILSS